MVTKYIDVDDGSWGVLVIYNYSIMDFDELAAIMDSFGLSNNNVRKALRVLSTPNTGMTISRSDFRMSVVFVSETSRRSEFWNTIAHELKHVHDAILDYYDVPLDGEPSAYTVGYLFQQVVQEIAEPCY